MKPEHPDLTLPLLAIDTATPACSVALRIDGRIFKASHDGPLRHTKVILKLVDRCLQEAAITARDLGAVTFCAGPGAFTGLRVGAAVAAALATGAEVPLGGVSSLAVLAAGITGEKQVRVLALLDARMKQCYAGFYSVGATVRALGDDRLSAPEELPHEWLDSADKVIGPGLVYRERFTRPAREELPDLRPQAHNLFRCLTLVTWQSALSPIELRYLRDEVARR